MKRIVSIIVIALLGSALVACGGGAALNQEQVDEAFIVSISAFLMGSMGAAFGADVEGVSFDVETGELSMDGFDITNLETDYTAISGSAGGDGTSMTVEATLTGGAVNSISYEVGDFTQSETIDATVTANGKSYDISIGPEALGM